MPRPVVRIHCDERWVLSAVTAVGGGAQTPSLPERRDPASVEPSTASSELATSCGYKSTTVVSSHSRSVWVLADSQQPPGHTLMVKAFIRDSSLLPGWTP